MKCSMCDGTGYLGAKNNPDTPLELMKIGCCVCSVCNGTGDAQDLAGMKIADTELCFANKGDSETNMQADLVVDHAMKMIDAEDEDHANIRGVVERMLAAGYTLTETCDPVGYDD